MPEDAVYPHEDASTTLINIRNHSTEDVDEYIGGETESTTFEPQGFENPYDKTEKGRDSAVLHYKAYFYRRYLTDEKFRKAAHAMEGKTLGCWCYPRRCHGEIIVDVLNTHEKEGIEGVLKMMEERLDSMPSDKLGVDGFREYEKAVEALEEMKEKVEI